MLVNGNETVENILLSNVIIKEALLFLENSKMTDCIIGGGLLRNAVWNHLYGFDDWHGMNDIDIQYYTPSTREWRIANRNIFNHEINFKNQAFVHEMYLDKYNKHVRKIESIEDGVSSWSEICSCIGIGPYSKNKLIAPYGVQELLSGIVSPNLTRANIGYINEEYYTKRIDKMRIKELYPQVIILDSKGEEMK